MRIRLDILKVAKKKAEERRKAQAQKIEEMKDAGVPLSTENSERSEAELPESD